MSYQTAAGYNRTIRETGPVGAASRYIGLDVLCEAAGQSNPLLQRFYGDLLRKTEAAYTDIRIKLDA